MSLLHFFKVGEIMFKYGSLMLPAGHIVDLYCVRLSNAVPFCENYTKFYLFRCKTLKKVLDRSGRGGGVKFLVPFLANIERWTKFLEYAPTRGITRYNYPWNWFYRWSSSSVLCSIYKNTSVVAGNLQMIASKFWFEYLWGPYALFLDPVLCIALVS